MELNTNKILLIYNGAECYENISKPVNNLETSFLDKDTITIDIKVFYKEKVYTVSRYLLIKNINELYYLTEMIYKSIINDIEKNGLKLNRI